MADEKKRRGGNLAVNRKALHDYAVLEKYEAGLALVGTEVKVVRNGEASLTGAYAKAADGQIFLHQLTIPLYTFGNRFNHESLRTRRVLMHKGQIRKLQALQEQKGLSLVPLRLYLTPKGVIKVELGVCRGKTQQDRRETVRRREADLDARRAMTQQ